jgi:nucleoside-diphosphate-sugar epimerase
MQKFTTMLRLDLINKREIFLPASKARFAMVDVADVGNVAAQILIHPEKHRNSAYDLTADEKHTFSEMAAILSKVLQTPIRYVSPSLLQFYRTKRKEGFATGYILVLIMLHYLPRFQNSPPVSQSIREIAGHAPTSFREFVEQNKAKLLA